MSDDEHKAESGADDPTPPSPHEPEPEGGPSERQRQFLEERFAKLGPKPQEGDEEPSAGLREREGAEPRDAIRTEREGPEHPPPADREDEPSADRAADAMDAEEPEEPGGERRRLMDEYRRRLEAHPPTEREAGPERLPPEERTDEAERDLEPPTPPQAPPANNWVPIGPSVVRQGQSAVKAPTSGRTPGIAVASGGNRIYAATANGGVWRSDDTGQTWRSLMDAFDLNLPNAGSDSLACGAIAIAPNNPDRIYVGSGEGAGGAYFGVGPIVSNDGGTTWATEAVAPGSQPLAGTAFYALAVDPGNPDRVVAGTRNGIYRREPNGSGGFHWAQKTTNVWTTSVVVARTGTTTTFYAANWYGPVLSSTDGHTWATVGTGFPTNAAQRVGRVGLAVQPNNPAVVYALVAYFNPNPPPDANNGSAVGVWRLNTSDNVWRQVTAHPTDLFGVAGRFQGGYDLAIAVDPGNVDRIYLGGATRLEGTGASADWSAALYRSTVTSTGSGTTLSHAMTNTAIGASVHADVHTLAFAPSDGTKLWVGCDGGVFYSTNPTGSGNIFEPRNTGLQTLMLEYLGQHPTEDAVLFTGSQDNGGIRFTGEEAWLYSSGGDGGYAVVNWNDPYRVLSTYVRGGIRRSTDGGTRYSYANVNVPLASGTDLVRFYAPLVGTPRNPATPAQAERVAFGSNRAWISEDFGSSWSSIPAGTAADVLGTTNGFRIAALAFTSSDRLFAGTENGQVHRYDRSGTTWTRTRIDNVTAGALPLAGAPITSIAVDPADATGASIFVTFGGTGDFRHVWRFNGTQWQARSGPSAGHVNSLLDVQHNAIVVDPANAQNVFVGADLGVWASTDGGQNWAPLAWGLPDAAVLDLALHPGRRLLRAATHGRSAWEWALDPTAKPAVELYVRDTQLDQGRFTTVNGLPDPTDQGEFVRHWAGPDIKLDTPDAGGNYQFPITPGTTIGFEQFVNDLTDDFRNVATHAMATITTRVYVQVHNRGVTPAHDVRVMLLLANASPGLPNLPSGFATNVQTGTPINAGNWRTVGFVELDDVRVGFPKIAAFDLPSSMLPPPASLTGNDHHCVLALVHHKDDQFTATQVVTDNLSRGERKAAHKNLKVVQFTGTLPPAGEPPVVMPVQINGLGRRLTSTTLIIAFKGYRGRVRAWLPKLPTKGSLLANVEGAKRTEPGDASAWAKQYIEEILRNQAGDHPYDREWSKQRIDDVEAVLDSGLMLVGDGRKGRVTIKNLALKPGTRGTIFLLFDRPRDTKPGSWFPVEVIQVDTKTKRVLGGLSARIEVVPKPRARPSVARPRAKPAALDIPELVESG